jgi:hypothetical protein
MSLESELVQYLTANPGLAALVGTRIYPLRFPQRVTLPAIRYQVISTIGQVAHTGPSGLRMYRVQLTAAAATYDAAAQAAAALWLACDGRKGLLGPGSSATVVNDLPDDEPESGVFFRHVDVELWR